jgi:hypothetical protein
MGSVHQRRQLSWHGALCVGTALWSLAGCAGEGDESDVQRTDSAGIEIVVSSGVDRPLERQFRRLFTLGGADEGPEAFFRISPGLIGADAAGRLYVLDPTNSRVVVFDADGRYLRTMGSRGGGPGEFGMPASVSVSPDGAVAVFDFAKGHLVRFDPAGGIADEEPFPIFPAPNQQRHFEQFHDTTVVSASQAMRDEGTLRQVLRQIAGVDTLVLLELPLAQPAMAIFEQCGGGLQLPPIFAPEIAWAAMGGRVAVTSTADYAVSFWEAGRRTRIVRRDLARVPATREEAVRHLGEGMLVNFGRGPCLIDPGEMVEKRGFADVIPPIRTVLLGPTGELWVQRFTVDPTASMPVDVFDSEGAYVGTLLRESFQPVILLPDGRVGVVEKDELDVERLAVYAMEG